MGQPDLDSARPMRTYVPASISTTAAPSQIFNALQAWTVWGPASWARPVS